MVSRGIRKLSVKRRYALNGVRKVSCMFTQNLEAICGNSEAILRKVFQIFVKVLSKKLKNPLQSYFCKILLFINYFLKLE